MVLRKFISPATRANATEQLCWQKLHNIAWGQEGPGDQERPPIDSPALSQLPVGIRNKECSNLASQRMTSSHGHLVIFYPQLNTYCDASGHMQLHQDRGAGPSSVMRVSSHSVNRYLLSAYYVTGISSKVKTLTYHLFVCLSVHLFQYLHDVRQWLARWEDIKTLERGKNTSGLFREDNWMTAYMKDVG